MNKTETNNDKNKGLEIIKNLHSLSTKDGGLVLLVDNIKSVSKKLDGILDAEKQREKEIAKAKKEAKDASLAEAEAKKPKKQKFVEPTADTLAVQPEPVTKPVVKEPVVEVKVAEKVEEPKKEVKAKEESKVPSWVKGTYKPAPEPVAQPRQYTPRPQGGAGGRPYNNNQGGAPRQFNNTQGGAPRQFNNNQGGAPRQFNNTQGGARPQGGQKPAYAQAPASVPAHLRGKGYDNKRKDYSKGPDDKKGGMNKRTLIRKGFIADGYDQEHGGTIRQLKKKKQEVVMPALIVIEKAIITTENLTVKILSEKIGKSAQDIIKQLMMLGIMTSINSVVDFQTMELVANELGVELELQVDKTQEELLEQGHDVVDDESTLVKRSPIITVMGHVDHGKTSLLDRIRKTSVADGEAGGITQHIGAYSVKWNGEKITFLDTPGHEAFSQMRLRGAMVTDIAILVVAADDGIMPQTIEAIKHAKSANVPIIVAVNKIDKPGANIDKVKQMLMTHEVVSEEYGGDTIIVPISAKSGENIDKLLESILLLADVYAYRANPVRSAKGSVIEARIDKGRGPVANIIVQNGTLKIGDVIVSGTAFGKVRAMTDDKGRSVTEAGPSTPVSILGLTEVPMAGSSLLVVEDEKIAKQVASERIAKIKNQQLAQGTKVTFEDILQRTDANQLKDLNVIVKGDVQGSVEAVKSSLAELKNEEVKVNVVSTGVGTINKSDIMIAEVSKAIVIGFNVKADTESKIMADHSGIKIEMFKVIYEAIDYITNIMTSMITPKYKENITGRAQVRNVFKITGSGIVAGSYVTSGKIYRNSKVRVFRGEEVVFEGALSGLKRFKDDAKDVSEGYECGISVDGFSDIKENDEIEAFFLEQIN